MFVPVATRVETEGHRLDWVEVGLLGFLLGWFFDPVSTVVNSKVDKPSRRGAIPLDLLTSSVAYLQGAWTTLVGSIYLVEHVVSPHYVDPLVAPVQHVLALVLRANESLECVLHRLLLHLGSGQNISGVVFFILRKSPELIICAGLRSVLPQIAQVLQDFLVDFIHAVAHVGCFWLVTASLKLASTRVGSQGSDLATGSSMR